MRTLPPAVPQPHAAAKAQSLLEIPWPWTWQAPHADQEHPQGPVGRETRQRWERDLERVAEAFRRARKAA